MFWVSIAMPVYIYMGYPPWSTSRRNVLVRPVRKQAIEPSVSVVIAAYNEQTVSRRR